MHHFWVLSYSCSSGQAIERTENYAPVLNHSLQNSISHSSIYTRSMDLNGVRTVTHTSSVCLGSAVFLHIFKINLTLECSQSEHIVIFDDLISQSPASEVEVVLAHELGHWYYLHPTKLMIISQLHIFSVLAAFPAFLHAPPLLRSFDFPKHVAAKPPTLIAFMLFQVCVSFSLTPPRAS